MGRHDSMGRHKACPYDVIIVDDHGIVAVPVLRQTVYALFWVTGCGILTRLR
jgi:hypothetical protein